MRIKRIREKLRAFADALIITSDVNRFYASGMNSSAGFMIITNSTAELFLDFRYYEAAVKKQQIGLISSDVKITLMSKAMSEHCKDVFSQDKVKTVALENKALTHFEYESLKSKLSEYEIIGAGDCINSVRMIKDESEISSIVKAQEITDKAFSHILSYIKPDLTEKDLALELEFFMRKNGADGIAFDTICVSGVKSSLPHGVPDEAKITKGFLTMDFGARFNGYCSDMTRTVCIGNPDEEMRKVYNTVLTAQKLAFEKIHGGVTGKEVDLAARDYIYSNGYEGCFGHSTGHSLGIEIHENPNFSPKSEDIIPAGAVLSVEPGIYIMGKYGVRIEDIVVVTEKGYENLTKSSKDLIIL